MKTQPGARQPKTAEEKTARRLAREERYKRERLKSLEFQREQYTQADQGLHELNYHHWAAEALSKFPEAPDVLRETARAVITVCKEKREHLLFLRGVSRDRIGALEKEIAAEAHVEAQPA